MQNLTVEGANPRLFQIVLPAYIYTTKYNYFLAQIMLYALMIHYSILHVPQLHYLMI